jgi:type II secretory pathway pseudopilin PulG
VTLLTSPSRRAQGAFEFIFLLGIVILLSTLALSVVQGALEEEQQRRANVLVQEFYDRVRSEFSLAGQATEEYARTFRVNPAAGGFPVRVSFGDSPTNRTDEIVISYRGNEKLFFLPEPVTYTDSGQQLDLSEEIRVVRTCGLQTCSLSVQQSTNAGERLGAYNAPPAWNQGRALQKFGSIVYAAYQDAWAVFDVSKKDRPLPLFNYTGGGEYGNAVLVGNDLLVADTGGGAVGVWDVSAGFDAPVSVQNVSTPSPKHLVRVGSTVYVITPSLVAAGQKDAGSWQVSSFAGGTSLLSDATYVDGYLFVASTDSSNPALKVYDVRNPYDISLNNTVTFPSAPANEVRSVESRGEIIYVVMDGEIRTLRASGPSLTAVDQLGPTGEAYSESFLRGNTLFVALQGSDPGVEQYSVDASGVSLSDSYAEDNPEDVVADKGYAYTTGSVGPDYSLNVYQTAQE